MALGGVKGVPVAYLEIRREGAESNGTQEDPIEIFGNKQFFIGRNVGLCERSWPDPTISNKHVRVHCILYESDPVANIPPFVYATDISTNGTCLKKCNEACASSQTDRGILMGKNEAFLLDDGDELRISESLTLVYHEFNPVAEVELTLTQERERPAFASRYLVTGRLLGVGAFGKVMVAIRQKTQHQLACKVVNLKGLYNSKEPPDLRQPLLDPTQQSMTAGVRKRWPSQVARCFREFEILEDLVHPNIVSIEKVFWSPDTIYIFEELVTGGDLFSFIEYKGGHLTDIDAAVIVRQVLKGIEYLHDRNIVHRDLKPDNILMSSLEDGARIVITDFGNARFLPESQGSTYGQLTTRSRMFSIVGTLEFAAPEIHQANQMIPRDQGYSKAVDMWSIGSITSALLSGDVLFTDRAHSKYYANPCEVIIGLASRCDISVLDNDLHPLWRRVGSRPKDFIKNLLILSETDRMTVTEALDHPWFSNECHAAEFEALYERSTKDWAPRRRDSQLVEAILVPHRGALSEQILSQQYPTCAREQSASQSSGRVPDSQYRPQPSPLAPVVDEYEEARFEGTGHHDEECDEVYSEKSPGQGFFQSRRLVEDDESRRSLNQLSTDVDPPVSGIYSSYGNAQDHFEYADRVGEAINGIDYGAEESVPVAFPPGYIRRRASQAESLSSIVYETQVDEVNHPDYIRQQQSPCSTVYKTSVREKNSRTHAPEPVQTITPWTSIDVASASKRHRSRDPALPSYSEFYSCQDTSSEAPARHSRSGRSKRTRRTAEYE